MTDPEDALEELRRRNPNALAMDVLYLTVTAFFAHLLTRGPWPALVSIVPLLALLYLGWQASRPFFLTQLAAIAVTLMFSFSSALPP